MNLDNDPRMEKIKQKTNTWGYFKRMRFFNKYKNAIMQCYNVLCTDCKLRLHRIQKGDFKRCNDCEAKCQNIMQPLLDELNEK